MFEVLNIYGNKKGSLDFVEKILTACYNSNKDDLLVMSLMHQYEDRVFLTKGQLQGLFYKDEKVVAIASAKELMN